MKVAEEFYTFFKKNNDKVGILFPSFLIKKATYLIYIFLKYGSHFVQNSIFNHNPHLHFKTLISNFSIPANILKYSFFYYRNAYTRRQYSSYDHHFLTYSTTTQPANTDLPKNPKKHFSRTSKVFKDLILHYRLRFYFFHDPTYKK